MSRILSSSLPIARFVLQALIILNILAGIAILALLFVVPNREWIIVALKLQDYPNADQVIWGLRAVAALGIVSIAFNHLILKRLLAVVDTVRDGDPFVAENAYRLQAIAWFLLILQLLSLAIAAIGRFISSPGHEVELEAGFSLAGWLSVLLMFVLARVFAEGAVMRRDLQGTI
jgi:Protein of unknown function (DUF2975)